jgi:hypothetical protein
MTNEAVGGRIFALSVAINGYERLAPLSGCINDVDAFTDWLRGRIPKDALSHKRLVDAEATRAAVSDAFRAHLGQARRGDVAVFHFAGHGRRSTQATEFNVFDPDGHEEGLVLWDSEKTDEGFDLADKELVLLVDDVAATGADVVLLIDCCHSGTLTRDAGSLAGYAVRSAPERSGESKKKYFRGLKDYADGRYLEMQKAGRFTVPAPRHMLLAAAERRQLAKERNGHGAFTSALLRALEASGGALSYAELFQKVRVAVRDRVADQDPQFEAISGFDGWSGFLGLGGAAQPARFELVFRDDAWRLAAGAVHGVSNTPDSSTVVTIFEGDEPIGTARVVRVSAQKSVVDPGARLNKDRVYSASLRSLPVGAMAVACDLPLDLSTLLEQALEDDAGGVVLAAPGSATAQRVHLQDGAVTISDATTGSRLWAVVAERGWWTMTAGALRRIAAWTRLSALATPRRGARIRQLDPAKFEAQLLRTTPEGERTPLPDDNRFSVSWNADKERWETVRLGMQLRNRLGQSVYTALFLFNDDFGIACLDNRELPPGEDWTFGWGADGRKCRFGPYAWQQQTTMRLKLIVSTEPLDDFLLVQDALALPPDAPPAVPTRGGVTDDDDEITPVREDWFVKDFVLSIVGAQARLGPQAVQLADGALRIEPHPRLTGIAALVGPAAASRGADAGDAPVRSLARGGVSLADFGGTAAGTRSATGGAGGVLDLSALAGTEGLADEPLVITARPPLAPDEVLMPFIYDGEDLIPVPDMTMQEGGGCTLRIRHLPPTGERSVLGALKLYFFKTVLKTGTADRLRWVDCSGAEPRYGSDGIASRVAAAKRVLLIVHGLWGDTSPIAEGLIVSGLASQFDLVLAWDYENLNTPLGDVAESLKSSLMMAGFGADDGRHLTLLTHCMGGLVARSLVEQSDGAVFIDHVVMCGTPNGGSPAGRIDTVRSTISWLTGLAGPKLATLFPWVAAILVVLDRSKTLTVTLEQLSPGGELVKSLGRAADPNIRYTVIAGDIAACEAAGDPLPRRLAMKLGQSAALGLLFGDEPHDAFASVPSMSAVPSARQPSRTVIGPVACHHLSYFSSPAGLAALKAIIY